MTDFGACYDCGRRYGDKYGFPDLVVPHEIWKQISPTGDEGGLLCPSCMCRRAYEAGIETWAWFMSGPFHPEAARNPEHRCSWCGRWSSVSIGKIRHDSLCIATPPEQPLTPGSEMGERRE